MSDHYSGNDPGTGCGMMILGIGVGALIFWAVFLAAMFDWGPFA